MVAKNVFLVRGGSLAFAAKSLELSSVLLPLAAQKRRLEGPLTLQEPLRS